MVAPGYHAARGTVKPISTSCSPRTTSRSPCAEDRHLRAARPGERSWSRNHGSSTRSEHRLRPVEAPIADGKADLGGAALRGAAGQGRPPLREPLGLAAVWCDGVLRLSSPTSPHWHFELTSGEMDLTHLPTRHIGMRSRPPNNAGLHRPGRKTYRAAPPDLRRRRDRASAQRSRSLLAYSASAPPPSVRVNFLGVTSTASLSAALGTLSARKPAHSLERDVGVLSALARQRAATTSAPGSAELSRCAGASGRGRGQPHALSRI